MNNYPKSVVEKTLKFVKQKVGKENQIVQMNVGDNSSNCTVTSITIAEVPIVHPHIIFLYQGIKGDCLLDRFKKVLNECLNNVVPRFIYKGKILVLCMGLTYHI